MKITSYNKHRSAPFFRALVVLRNQVYSELGADAFIQSAQFPDSTGIPLKTIIDPTFLGKCLSSAQSLFKRNAISN